MKKIIIIVTIVIFLMTGCLSSNSSKKYTGEYPELYSVAINSILGTDGYELTEVPRNSTIIAIEEDNYGRKLFFYFEYKKVSTFSLVICQQSDDKYSYFYPDYNFISIPGLGEEFATNSFQWIAEEAFAEEDIEELKRKNDWDKELDLDKCVQVKITRIKEKGPVKDYALAQFYNNALGEDAYASAYIKAHTSFLIKDEYGRSIYLGRGKSDGNGRYIVMLFGSDSSYDESIGLMELHDTENYQDALKEFKERNSWGKPIE